MTSECRFVCFFLLLILSRSRLPLKLLSVLRYRWSLCLSLWNRKLTGLMLFNTTNLFTYVQLKKQTATIKERKKTPSKQNIQQMHMRTAQSLLIVVTHFHAIYRYFFYFGFFMPFFWCTIILVLFSILCVIIFAMLLLSLFLYVRFLFRCFHLLMICELIVG